MSDSDEDDRDGMVVGFMFGNVDSKGRLEEAYLDEVGVCLFCFFVFGVAL